MDLPDLRHVTGQSEIPELGFDEDKGFSEDLLGTPCYESAICSGAPNSGGSPSYWDVVSGSE
jgi:hypothetical protein